MCTRSTAGAVHNSVRTLCKCVSVIARRSSAWAAVCAGVVQSRSSIRGSWEARARRALLSNSLRRYSLSGSVSDATVLPMPESSLSVGVLTL